MENVFEWDSFEPTFLQPEEVEMLSNGTCPKCDGDYLVDFGGGENYLFVFGKKCLACETVFLLKIFNEE